MRLLHVTSSLSRKGGGPARSTQGLVAGLNAVGLDAYLLVMKPYGEAWVSGLENKVIYANCKNWFGMQRAVEKAIAEVNPDLVHIHSIWQWTLHLAVRAARKKDVPYIIAPRGTIEEWSLKQKWIKKKIALLTYQGNDFRHAVAFHVTSESEGNQVRKLGYSQPIIYSPNGVNVPEGKLHLKDEQGNGSTLQLQLSTSTKTLRRALFLSRMHPKKGVENLIHAWAKVQPKEWVCELVYTLSGEIEHAYEKQIKNLILSLGMAYQDKDGSLHSSTTITNFNFIFTGPLPDEAKWAAYARSDLFVLPSYSENFGIVVAEALWAGVPVITTTGTPWQDLTTHSCGWWVNPTIDAFTTALTQATAIDGAQLSQMGMAGHVLIEEKYTWSVVCKSLVEAYKKLLK